MPDIATKPEWRSILARLDEIREEKKSKVRHLDEEQERLLRRWQQLQEICSHPEIPSLREQIRSCEENHGGPTEYVCKLCGLRKKVYSPPCRD